MLYAFCSTDNLIRILSLPFQQLYYEVFPSYKSLQMMLKILVSLYLLDIYIENFRKQRKPNANLKKKIEIMPIQVLNLFQLHCCVYLIIQGNLKFQLLFLYVARTLI